MTIMKIFCTTLFILFILFRTQSQTTSFNWANAYYGSWQSDGNNIDVDSYGNLYVSGNLANSTDFDPSIVTYTLSSAGQNDVFIAKYSSSGNLIWAKKIGSSGDDFAYSMKVDSMGNTYITGVFSGTVDFDPDLGVFAMVSLGAKSAFVLKLDFNGRFVWAKNICNIINQSSITLSNKNSEVILTGDCSDTTDLNPNLGVFKLGTIGSNYGTFILKLDTSGSFIWAKRSTLSSSVLSFQSYVHSNNNSDIFITETI